MDVPAWQLSLIIGAGTFAGLSLYNKFTQDPDELNSNKYLMKASFISSIIVLITSCVLNTKGSGSLRPSENILTEFGK